MPTTRLSRLMCGRSPTFRDGAYYFLGALPLKSAPKFQLSRDSQALYITVVAKGRLPVSQSDAIKLITCQAIDEARKSGGFLLFAYVIMRDHLHLLTDYPGTSADVLRRIKGLTARRVDYLREHDFQSSLAKLRHEEWKRKRSYSLWQQEKNVFSILSEAVFYAKGKLHPFNPVRAELVEREILAAPEF